MNREQGRAVVLTAIMVVSVFAMGFAFAGGAAASDADRNASDGGAVEEGAEQVEVLDFNLTSEDQVLDSSRPDTGNDGDVEPGDDLTALAPGEYSYIDDNNDEDYDADETLIYDGNGSGQLNNAKENDEFDNQSEVIRYTDGAFRPYFFESDDLFFTDVENGYGDRGTYTGEKEDYDNDQNVQHEAILRVPTVDDNGARQINQLTNPITSGQANLTAFPTGVDTDNGKAYIHDADGDSTPSDGVDYEPGEGDFIFVAGDGDQQYDAGSEDTVVAGPVPPGDESNTQSLAGTQIGERLFFLDFKQDGEFNVTEGDGSEPLVLLTEDENIGNTDTGDALPNTAKFVDPAAGSSQVDGGIDNNYYEQYDDIDGSGPGGDGEEFEEGADDRDNDGTVKDVGLQSMSSTDTLFLDDEAPDQDPVYTGEDDEDEDVVENDLTESYPLVDGSQENFKNEDLGPDYGDGFDSDDAVIRGQGLPNSQSGLNLYEEANQVGDDEPDNFEELVLVNEVADCEPEDSGAYVPGQTPTGSTCDTGENVKYGDAMVDLTVANTGSATDNGDIAAATLYRESDGNAELSAGDTKVSGSNFQQNDLVVGAPGQYVFQSLDQLYGNGSTDDSQQFYVGVNLQEEADGTLQFAIPKYRDGQTRNAFDPPANFINIADGSDTGLFLESAEAFSTGPFTDSDGNNPSPNYYDLSQSGSVISGTAGLIGTGPIVTEQTLTIADSEAPPAPGEITASDQDFGSVDVGDSTTRTVSVLNTGDQSVTVDSASVSGADAGDFAITSGGTPFSLAPDENRDITVEFAPGTEGDKSADLDISTANANSETVALSGTANAVDDGDNEHTLEIIGTDDYTPYWLRAPGQITDTTSLTAEDDVSSDSAGGAVGPGSDTYNFTGDPADLQLYVPTGASVFIDGSQVNPDDYESQVSFVGDGDFSSYNFEVKNGQITDSSGLTSEDNIDQSDDAASGAVAAGSDSYTFTGSFQGVDIDGGADLMINGHDADPSTFYNTLRFEGQGSLATYDFSVSGEIENTAGVTGEDSVSQNGADGAIKGGSDVYVYSGTLDNLEVNGDIVIDRNGEVISDGYDNA